MNNLNPFSPWNINFKRFLFYLHLLERPLNWCELVQSSPLNSFLQNSKTNPPLLQGQLDAHETFNYIWDGSRPCSKKFNNSLKAINFKIARQLKFLKSFLFSPWDLSVCLFGSWSEPLQASSETKYYLLFLSSFFWTFAFFLLLFLKTEYLP